MTIKLTRSGNAPLLIDGDLIADADGQKFRGKDRNRWFRILIYRTADGYAAQVRFFTGWEGEAEWHNAATFRNLAQLVEWLNTCQRQPAAIGYPIGEQFTERQRRLLAELDAQYATLVSHVLDADGMDWAGDHPPTEDRIAWAVDRLDAFFADGWEFYRGEADAKADLADAVEVLQSAKRSEVIAAAERLIEKNYDEEVPDAT